jgi:hypothetical protein
MDDMQPKMSIDEDGDIFWQMNGQNHRVGGPACEFANGNKLWCQFGRTHRTDGPAIEHADGNVEWRLSGHYYSFEGWLAKTTGLTDEEKVMMKLKYG